MEQATGYTHPRRHRNDLHPTDPGLSDHASHDNTLFLLDTIPRNSTLPIISRRGSTSAICRRRIRRARPHGRAIARRANDPRESARRALLPPDPVAGTLISTRPPSLRRADGSTTIAIRVDAKIRLRGESTLLLLRLQCAERTERIALACLMGVGRRARRPVGTV